MGVLYEALGFAVTRFSTVLRVAWLPLALLLLLQGIALQLDLEAAPAAGLAAALRTEPGYMYQFLEAVLALSPIHIAFATIAVILHASYMVPLIRYASNGTMPHHGSMHLEFGWRHLKYVGASLLSFPVIAFAASAVAGYGGDWAGGGLKSALERQRTVFEEGSLHSVETEPVFGGLQGLVASLDQFLMRLGINVSATETVVIVPVLVVAVYLMLRLFALPYLAAAREAGDGYNSFGRSLAVSSGFNIFPLIAVMILFALVHLIMLTLFWFSLGIFNWAMIGSEAMITSFDNMLPEASAGPIIRGLLTTLLTIGIVMVSAMVAGLTAGLGGALVHRAVRTGPQPVVAQVV
jgi:hypothetical protein